MGGEKKLKYGKINLEVGSPPRGRGKGCQFWDCQKGVRITPAWAGKSNNQPTAPGVCGDHPRVGGEKSRVAPRSDPGTGSPPRGRGKAHSSKCRCGWYGITPAWAGKSFRQAGEWCPRWDHPRVGGEKLKRIHSASLPQGSPPRGRGKAGHESRKNRFPGITPAWAGKS